VPRVRTGAARKHHASSCVGQIPKGRFADTDATAAHPTASTIRGKAAHQHQGYRIPGSPGGRTLTLARFWKGLLTELGRYDTLAVYTVKISCSQAQLLLLQKRYLVAMVWSHCPFCSRTVSEIARPRRACGQWEESAPQTWGQGVRRCFEELFCRSYCSSFF